MSFHDSRRVRLRLQEFEVERSSDGGARARVRMDWTRDRSYRGEAEGTQTRQGELQAAARATLQAAQRATRERLNLELRGVKAVRVFDSWVVVVLVRGWAEEEGDHPLRLMGALPCPDANTPRCAALAVLDAINRVLEPYLED